MVISAHDNWLEVEIARILDGQQKFRQIGILYWHAIISVSSSNLRLANRGLPRSSFSFSTSILLISRFANSTMISPSFGKVTIGHRNLGLELIAISGELQLQAVAEQQSDAGLRPGYLIQWPAGQMAIFASVWERIGQIPRSRSRWKRGKHDQNQPEATLQQKGMSSYSWGNIDERKFAEQYKDIKKVAAACRDIGSCVYGERLIGK